MSRPGILALLSSDEMNKTIYPAVVYLTKYLGLSDLKGDILYLPLSSLLQGYYLFHYNASLSEHYWGLTRAYLTPSSRSSLVTSSDNLAPFARSIPAKLLRIVKVAGFVEAILGPWLQYKVQGIHNDGYHGDEMSKAKELIAKLYPYLNLAVTVINSLFKLAYYLEFTDNYSLVTAILGLKYVTSPGNQPRTKLGKFQVAMELIFPISMFYIQFIKQWSRIELSPYELQLKPPPPYTPHPSPNICPLCGGGFKIPTAIPTTGIVYCYVCVFSYVRDKGTCPVTSLPVRTNSLVKLNLT